jgi:transporter family-2 protein
LIQIIVASIYYAFSPADSFSAPVWAYFGGPLMAIFIVLIGFTTFKLGAAISIALILSTQLAVGVIVDYFGLFGLDAVQISPLRLVLIVISVVAVLVVTLDSTKETQITDQRSSSDSVKDEDVSLEKKSAVQHLKKLGLIFIAAVNGVFLGIGSTLLGSLGRYTSPSYASIVSSALGFGSVFIFFLADLVFFKTELNFQNFLSNAEWWVYFTGWAGALYTIVAAYLLPELGVSLFFCINNCFQIITALVMDYYGIFGVTRSKLSILELAGSAILLFCTIYLSIL